jgi:hypothetical protein
MATQYHMILVTDDAGASARFDVLPDGAGGHKWHGPTKLDGNDNPGVRHDVMTALWLAMNPESFGLQLEFEAASQDNRLEVACHGDGPVLLPMWDESFKVATLTFLKPTRELFDYDITCRPAPSGADGVPKGVTITVRVRTGTSPQPGPPLRAAR